MITKSIWTLLTISLLTLPALGQVQIDKPIDLNGLGSNAKITGIKDVSGTTDAVSAGVLQNGGLVYSPTAGGPNAYTLSLTPAPASYVTGMEIRFKANTANAAGGVTLKVNTLAALPIKKDIGVDLAAGDIQTGQLVTVAYDGTNFQLLSRITDANSGGTVTSINTTAPITGGTISNTGTIGITQSGTSANGYLSSTDWNTFNGKQPAGNYITALSGDVTAAGPGSVTATITPNAVTSAKILDNEIVNADINAGAAITDTKLATISTSGKVSNSATTGTATNTPSTLVLRDGSGNFSAGTITAALSGNATSASTAATATNFSGSLAGDVTGTQAATAVAKINGSPLGTTTGASTGDVLKWNGAAWAKGTDANSGGTVTGTGTANYMTKWTSSSALSNTSLVFDNGTNVGIGIITPNNLLHVDVNSATASTDAISIANRGVSALGHTAGLRFQYVTAVPAAIRARLTNLSTGAADLGLFTSPDGTAANLAERLTVMSTGKVGIGTLTPTKMLEVLATDGEAARLYRNASTATFGVNIRFALNNSNNSEVDYAGVHGQINSNAPGAEAGNLLFTTATTGSLTEKMRIDPNGFVGVGNNAPAVLMDLKGNNVSYGGQLRIAATDYDQITFYNSANMGLNGTGRLADIYYDIAGQVMNIENQQSNKYLVLNQGGGNVGIGITAPAARLSLLQSTNTTDGGLRCYNTNQATWTAVYTGGDNAAYFQNPAGYISISSGGSFCSSGGFNSCSDARYKKDLQPLTGVLQNLENLHGYYYYWKKEEFPERKFTANKQIGVIAQEIEKVYPEVVFTGDDGYKTVDYSRLTPILLQAIKELNTEVNNLKIENTQFKADAGRVDELEKKFAEMKQYIFQESKK